MVGDGEQRASSGTLPSSVARVLLPAPMRPLIPMKTRSITDSFMSNVLPPSAWLFMEEDMLAWQGSRSGAASRERVQVIMDSS